MLFNQLGNKGNELSVCFCDTEFKFVSPEMVCLGEPVGTGNQCFVEKAMRQPMNILPLQIY